jgi:hypothetical protein
MDKEEFDIDKALDMLQLNIDGESVGISIDRGDDKDPIHVCYWHIEEVEEDADVAISMCNAIHLYYSDPRRLLELLNVEHLV